MERSDLGPVYTSLGLVTEAEVAAARDYLRDASGLTLAGALEVLGIINELALTRALCHQSNLPFVDLRDAELPTALASEVPRTFAERFRVVPVKHGSKKLILASDDPRVRADLAVMEDLLSNPLALALATATAFRVQIRRLR